MSIKRSESFIILKSQSQTILDFSVLVCTAVPQLNYAFKQNEKDSSVFLAKNTVFRESNEPYSTEKRMMNKYKKIQGANLLLSNFSFFESYFFSLIDEIIEFHGGSDKYIEFIRNKLINQVHLTDEELKHLKKLRKRFKPAHSERFKKFTDLLSHNQIIWPSQRLALYGINQILANKKRWKSVNIPTLVKDLLVYDLDPTSESRFHNIRDDRNKIAHGKKMSYDLEKAIDINYFLYNLAKEIDEHVVMNFLITEKYR